MSVGILPLQSKTAPANADIAVTWHVEALSAQAIDREYSCSNCYVRNVCLPSNLRDDELIELDELIREKRKTVRGAALYRQGDILKSLYVVRSGAFKSVGAVGAENEKVTGLHLPGDILGLDAINGRVHGYGAVALEDSDVCVLPYAALTRLTLRIPTLQEHLLRALSGDIVRDRGLMLRLGSMSAEQRLAAFLVALSDRHQRLGYASSRFNMRMMRQEIASYLGLTVETVSRLFSRLQHDRVIEVRGREVQVKDVPGLRKLVGY